MSRTYRDDCTRSVSDGDLVKVQKEKPDYLHFDDAFSRDIDRQVFFTLPRWISGRKKKRSKIKYIKVDVPFRAEKNEQGTSFEKTAEKSNTFLSRLFRSGSFSNVKSSKKSSNKLPVIPVAHVISSSNTDIRNSNGIIFHSIDYQEFFKDKIPAVCGIKNHGNTCFMNAVMQCLSNTDCFAEYFVMDHFKMDFLRRNKTHSKKYGTRGEVTEQLGALLKSLWSCQYFPNVSCKFKDLVAKYGTQYEGSDQHDAQEFLLWLLDKVHEDLNTASKQKYKKPRGSLGRTDEDIAAETLSNHLRCNSSFINDLFQGQFRSSLRCQRCGRYSNTFDPYLCVSLPVPHCQTSIYLHLIFLSDKLKLNKVGVLVDSTATVSDLCTKLDTSFGMPKVNILLTEIIDGKLKRTFGDADLVSTFKDSAFIYAIEMPPQRPNTNIEREKIVLIVINRIEDDAECKMFWRPFCLEVDREISYKALVNEVITTMSHVLKDDLDLDSKDLFSISVDTESTQEILSSTVDLPLYITAVDHALILSEGRGPRHLNVSINWTKESKDVLKTEIPFIDEHDSVASLSSRKSSDKVTLYECFDLYFNEERLGFEDAWMCSYCHNRLPCIKQLSLWTVPDVFIVHLKRFRQSSTERAKVTTFVDFPYSALDMNPYMAVRNKSARQHIPNGSFSSLTFWSPWKQSRTHSYLRWEDNTYDLYAVCNHHGSMQGGHYTAYCRNPVNGHWYLFDDSKVEEVLPNQVISADAYILFYIRSTLSSQSCASSSSSGYSSSSSAHSFGYDHWSFRMPPFLREGPVTSKSQDNLYVIGNTSSLDRRKNSLQRPFSRASKAYSTALDTSRGKAWPLKVPSECNNPCEGDILNLNVEIPPPPPPTKHYWTVTSV